MNTVIIRSHQSGKSQAMVTGDLNDALGALTLAESSPQLSRAERTVLRVALKLVKTISVPHTNPQYLTGKKVTS